MGIKQSPDLSQAIMEDIFRDFPDVEVYIDDLGVFSNSWEEHVKVLDAVLSTLQKYNFTVNPLKCEWGVQETDWLGYWLTPTGLKPWRKKIDSILALKRPTSVTELRSFIGGVTFYRDMFRRRSHLLAPLTAQVGKKNIQWSPECQKAFDEIKAVLARDAFLRYPDHNKDFHIFADASDLQLGAAICQDGAAVAYYSRKLTDAQLNYTVGEKELLSIVETLKEYRNMLYGAPNIHIYTDHRNNTFTKFQTQRVMRWRLYLEDFGPTFHYIKGENNTLADMLSRLPFSERQSSTDFKNPADQYKQQNNHPFHPDLFEEYDPLQVDSKKAQSFYSMASDGDDDLVMSFAHLPAQSGIPFVLDYRTIADAQDRDAGLQQLAQQEPERYVRQLLAPNTQVYCHIRQPNDPWKIYLPEELLDHAVRWYHLALSHVGSNRLLDTMSMHFYSKNLRGKVEDIVSKCDACQRYKLVGRGHGELAPREAEVMPWRRVAVDLIGPWTFLAAGQELKFSALTIIDLVTNFVEVVRIHNKSAEHVGLQFENNWLNRYPRPSSVVYDQGGEFIGHRFFRVLQRHGIATVPTTTKNPQANAVCERMHQAVGNALRVLTTLQPPMGIADAAMLVDTAISNAIFAHRASYSEAIRTSPGALVFGQDMVLGIPMIADLELIREHRQQLVDRRLLAANRKRFSYDYAVGDEVLKLVYKPAKLEPRAEGPYRVERVHANGTLTIRLSPAVIERISIRRVKPYRR